MFSRFSSSNSPLTAKRRKVSRACDFCREHRVRCEAATPCPQCVANHISCSRKSQSNLQRLPNNGRKRQSSPLDVDVDQEETISTLEQTLASRSNGPQDATSSAQLTPESLNVPDSGQRMDSMLGFIARIDAFCSGVSQLTTSMSPEGDAPPESTSPFLSSNFQEPSPMECSLTEVQISRLLLIFWTRLWPQVPIIRHEDLRYLRHSSQDSPSPLRDMIIAYCMQYVYYSGLHSRILGLELHQFQQNTHGSMIGLPYFQRCLRAVTQYSNFSQPSVLTLQCYCFMILYLLDAGQHAAAYNMIGLAIRIAQSLKSSANTGDRPQNLRLAWWMLVILDFRCSRYLGKPVSIRLQDLPCPPQARESEDLLGSENALYHIESIRLTAAVLAVLDKTDCYPINFVSNNHTAGTEAHAHALSHALHHLRQWKLELHNLKSLRHIKLDVEDTPADPNEEIEIQDAYLKQPPMEILLATLLELQYHNAIITIHRDFIQFPTHPLVPKSSPRGDEHSATALNHALAMIRLTHRRMTTHDAIHGISEIYQYIWNAVLTLAGFLLAYPYCYRCPRARQYIRLALEIFDSAGTQNTSPLRAASLTRHLCAKVDTLVQILNIDQPCASSGESDFVLNSTSETGAAGDMSSFSDYTALEVESQPPSSAHLNLSGESLWSWVDFMNVSAWPSYCDEVSEAFTDPTKM
ncbi:uncharacterized protein N7529_008827 [Penicillium soppii]|uniref:uncharacterized protein n=1 Tax=Penicillium soppii TaxID=69789 RepID=UPI002547B43C|nr:uncharacterized protein N7529_008827 [Penicillium soppii]KAJ5861517.1 hypothetical protein N7529_008827 [Penicillium soppii]